MARVLIVEDEIFVALDLEHIITSAGFDVCGLAADRKGAMAMASECDVALIDVNLHDGQTGPAIAVDLFSNHDVKIVFVTSHPLLVGNAGPLATGIITKPFRADMIVQAVRAAVMENDDIVGVESGPMKGFVPAGIAASALQADS